MERTYLHILDRHDERIVARLPGWQAFRMNIALNAAGRRERWTPT